MVGDGFKSCRSDHFLARYSAEIIRRLFTICVLAIILSGAQKETEMVRPLNPDEFNYPELNSLSNRQLSDFLLRTFFGWHHRC